MRQSEFRYTQPYIVDASFNVNKTFKREDKPEIDLVLKVNKYTNYETESNSQNAIVGLTIEIGEENCEKFPFYCKVSMESKFDWDEGTENIDAFLEQNAPALLLGYIRPIVTYLTANSPVPPVNIPLINFEDKE